MFPTFGVVDLFAGPGGLGEGFSAFQDGYGSHPFSIGVSIEKDEAAHATLQMRSFLRKFGYGNFPPEYYEFLNGKCEEPDWPSLHPIEWEQAEEEACLMELGKKKADELLSSRITAIRKKYNDQTILIGGPPCQAYSLVGRSRNAGIADYQAHKDKRNFLYRKYVDVLGQLEPTAFIMENVRGMLSHAVNDDMIFHRVLTDLRSAAGPNSYQLFALAPENRRTTTLKDAEPLDYIVRTENHGVPQARHRVIIVGLREDIVKNLPYNVSPRLRHRGRQVTVDDIIGTMPKLRSGLSKNDSFEAWQKTVIEAVDIVLSETNSVPWSYKCEFRIILNKCRSILKNSHVLDRRSCDNTGMPEYCPSQLRDFIVDPNIESLPNNETRGHMPSDLARYLFVSAFGKATGRSPKASEFPASLKPNHKNWDTGKFSDRFRVQVWDKPATTVTSHISKDGHYFIHPDPSQCRSLTVREAARLQTFPDNYLFKGNRTQQYVQVGNAVPPFLARQVAQCLWRVLVEANQNTDTDVRIYRGAA